MASETIGVAGLGLLGRGIAACCVAHGFRVIGYTPRSETHAVARQYIEHAITELIERAGFPTSLQTEWPRHYEAVDTLKSFAPCDFVIESVVEDPKVKKSVFDEIESVVRPDIPIASNTSSIPISQIQSDSQHADRFIGMHWGEPAHVTRFCELIRGDQTSDRTFYYVEQISRRFGKEPCLVRKDVPAFIVNRIGYAMYREAVHLLDTGVADAETIDRSCRNAMGLWASMCGPLRWIDITGGSASYGPAMARVLPTLDNSATIAPSLQQMIDDNCCGSANGKGFYEYAPGDKEYWERLFLEQAWAIREQADRNFPLTDESD